jgi:hypothetical protein
MTKMAAATSIAALFALVAVLGTSALLAVRALRAWRNVRSFSRATGAALERVMRTADEAETHAVAAAAGAERLATAAARLRESLARLTLIRSAAAEFSATLARFRGVVPRK